MNWQDLSSDSHYDTAVAIKAALQAGDLQEATMGIEELIDALSRSERRALESHLIRLMQHVIKWKVQPERRSPSWIATIREARRRIAQLQRRMPSLTDEVIRHLWEDCYLNAIDEAIKDMNREITAPPLTWEDVFEDRYRLTQD